MRAVGYAREGEGLPPLAEQIASIRAWAAELGLDLAAQFADHGVRLPASAGRPTALVTTKSGAGQLLDIATQEPAIVVIVATLAALERDDLPRLEMLPARVLEVGIDRIAVTPPPPPAPPPPPRLSIGERLLRGRRAGAAAGRHQSGVTPYGYQRAGEEGRRALIEQPVEAAIVRVIFEEYLRCKSMEKLVGILNGQGLRTRRGKSWSRAGVSWILKNETYIGRVHFGDIRSNGDHCHIISASVFNKAKSIILKNVKRPLNARRAAEVAA